jgi:uncharacterized protein (TIGR02646 family)
MRPVDRGPSPAAYNRYEDAKQDLVNRLGSYCSYCERRIATLLAVEHIQAKGLPQYDHLQREWTNFLLGCVNCNSAKLHSPVEFDAFLMPDRDNTFAAFSYAENGIVEPAPGLTHQITALALATRDLTALNRLEHPHWDEAIMFSAIERVGQRVQAWVQAKEARRDYDAGETSARAIAREAASAGFFSIWMVAFAGIPEVRRELLRVFPNTAPDCFDANAESISPRPDNGLTDAGKI